MAETAADPVAESRFADRSLCDSAQRRGYSQDAAPRLKAGHTESAAPIPRLVGS